MAWIERIARCASTLRFAKRPASGSNAGLSWLKTGSDTNRDDESSALADIELPNGMAPCESPKLNLGSGIGVDRCSARGLRFSSKQFDELYSEFGESSPVSTDN